MKALLILLALLACSFHLVGCGPAGPSEQDGVPCDEEANCSLIDGTETCEPGFVFEEPGSDDFTCRDTGWSVNDRIDPIDDSRDVNLTLGGPVYRNFAGRDIETGIGILCSDEEGGNSTMAFVVGTTVSDLNDVTDVVIRIGDAEAEELRAVDSNGVLFFDVTEGERLARAARTARTVALQFKPFELNTKTVVFETQDLGAVSEPFLDVCGF